MELRRIVLSTCKSKFSTNTAVSEYLVIRTLDC